MLNWLKFCRMAETGTRVPRNTHAPPILSGTLSKAGQRDQSITVVVVMSSVSLYESYPKSSWPEKPKFCTSAGRGDFELWPFGGREQS